LTVPKLHPPWPWFALTGVFALVPVLNNMYPTAFYPALPRFVVELISVFVGSGVAAMGFLRTWNRLQRASRAKALVLQVADWRALGAPQEENEVATSGRSIARLVGNVDEDLREIGPDFTLASLERLPKLLPVLLSEVGTEDEARVRLGVVGSYLGETLCRTQGFRWVFRADPALRRFNYLVSIVQKEGKELDPFLGAADLLVGRKKISDFMRGIQ